MPYLKTEENRIYYQLHRAAEAAPNLILVHGAGGSHLNWPAELQSLPGINVYALDLPGHGQSQAPARQSVDAYAGDLAGFVGALALRQVIVCGHSMGGAIAMTLALSGLREQVALVLIGTGARLRVNELILGQIRQDYAAAVSTLLQYSWSQNTPAELVEADRQARLEVDPAIVYGDYMACDSFDIMSRVNDILIPTLVISGTADQLTPEKYGKYLADQISQAEFVTITGGGHMMAQEQPRLVASVVAKFLHRLPPV
jgi:pimeloyl-ACP methyl ester carboxylesterase